MFYRFNVSEWVLHGPARGADVAAVRRVFEGSELSGATTIGGKPLLLKALTEDAETPQEEQTCAMTIGVLDKVQELSLLWTLSLITGNRVNSLLVDTFDDAGGLIEVRHQRGAGMSRGRNAPFRRFHGWITAKGIEQIADGITRLQRAGFPIETVLHHLTEANTRNLDLDGQHLSLAIHTALEAWNRLFGIDLWIDDEIWEPWYELLRKNLLRPVLKPACEDIGSEVVSNIWALGRHANRSTTAWRQTQIFAALEIDVSDADSQRVLAMRDELLHNGHFLTRFQQLKAAEQQRRLDDLARLRNISHTMVLRLTGFSGECFDFLTHCERRVEVVKLPTEISSQQN